MHLEGPWLTTTGKKKGPKKFASADHARKARALDESWQLLQKKWAIDTDVKKHTRAAVTPLSDSYCLTIPPGRNTTAHIGSVDTGGNALLKPNPVYTGTMVKGIATMHKSNAVPVFSNEQAVDISKMRR